MLDYTKAAIKQTADDFKKVDYIRNVATQVLYIAYLIYALIAPTGYLAANIPLLVLSVGYFIFFLIATHKRTEKKLKKIVKTVFTRCKQAINFFTLGVTVYGIWLTAEQVTPFSLILCSLMIVGWVLQIVFEIIIKFFSKRVNLIIEGLEADYENMTKPVRSVGNFFKKVTGKEIEEKEPTKARVFLDKKVEEAKIERKNQKIEARVRSQEEKRQKKLDKKQKKADEKAQRKAEKSAKKQAKKEEKSKVKNGIRSMQDESYENIG